MVGESYKGAAYEDTCSIRKMQESDIQELSEDLSAKVGQVERRF